MRLVRAEGDSSSTNVENMLRRRDAGFELDWLGWGKARPRVSVGAHQVPLGLSGRITDSHFYYQLIVIARP